MRPAVLGCLRVVGAWLRAVGAVAGRASHGVHPLRWELCWTARERHACMGESNCWGLFPTSSFNLRYFLFFHPLTDSSGALKSAPMWAGHLRRIATQVHHQGEDEFVAHDAVGAILEVGRRVPTMLPQMEALAQRSVRDASAHVPSFLSPLLDRRHPRVVTFTVWVATPIVGSTHTHKHTIPHVSALPLPMRGGPRLLSLGHCVTEGVRRRPQHSSRVVRGN